MKDNRIIANNVKTSDMVDFITDKGIKVRCHIPKSVPDYVCREHINAIYDILAPHFTEDNKPEKASE